MDESQRHSVQTQTGWWTDFISIDTHADGHADMRDKVASVVDGRTRIKLSRPAQVPLVRVVHSNSGQEDESLVNSMHKTHQTHRMVQRA